jgi:hypothetical protein
MSKPALSEVALKKIQIAARVPSVAREQAAEREKTVQPGRVGKTHITFFVGTAVKKQLEILGVERDLTIQAQMVEALNSYFATHGKPETAE